MDDVAKLRARLDEKIPRDVVREREGSGGRKFSYLEGHYVIARMNEIFGQGNWGYQTEQVQCMHVGKEERRNGEVHTAHYLAKVRIEVPVLGPAAIISDVGYGDGTDKTNPGKAHELAAKEAVTDALKRAAKSLGMSMGLALYDKEQTNVDDGDPAPAAKQSATRKADLGRAAPVAPASVADTDRKDDKAKAANPALPREKIDSMISSYAKVLQKQGKLDKDSIRALMKEKYGVENKADLTDAQAAEFMDALEQKTLS